LWKSTPESLDALEAAWQELRGHGKSLCPLAVPLRAEGREPNCISCQSYLLEFSKNSYLKINILAPLLPMPPPSVGALGTPPVPPIAFLAFVV
jgi:hypothetical protein